VEELELNDVKQAAAFRGGKCVSLKMTMGMPNRRILTIPGFLFRLYGRKLKKNFEAKGIETGLDMVYLADIQTANTFIDKSIIRDELGVTEDDIESAIGDSIKLCLESLEGKEMLLEMKAE
jgi:dihydroflavonol-4-reductase